MAVAEDRQTADQDQVLVVNLESIIEERRKFWIGLFLAISSSIFIGASFIIKKKALQKLSKDGQTRAGSGGYGYLKDLLWWSGLVSMAVGEGANFVAYSFTAASLVTPLGALSVIVTAILAFKYLGEELNLLGKIGCFLCVIGSTVIVIHSPKEGQVDSLDQLAAMLTETTFISYVCFVSFVSFWLAIFYAPKHGNKNIFIYIIICSLIGSLSVMACKGLGLAIKEIIAGTSNDLTKGLFWLFLISVVICVSVQMNYLNKALDIFDTSLVTPVYYVLFTTFVLIASSILFKEWNQMSGENILGSLCGFFTIIVAIFLLNGFKEFSIKLTDVIKKKQALTKIKVIQELNKRRRIHKLKKVKHKSIIPIEMENDLMESGSDSEKESFLQVVHH